MTVLEGTHGTSFSSAQKIRINGFSMGSGRGGKGVYFWRKGYYAENLANGWHEYKKSIGEFRRDKFPDCAVIFVELLVDPSEYLDMEGQSIKEALIALAEARKISDDLEEVAALYDLFISECEKQFQIKYKVLELQVAPPPRKFIKDYRTRLVGWPICYAVRDVACISIVRVRREQNETDN